LEGRNTFTDALYTVEQLVVRILCSLHVLMPTGKEAVHGNCQGHELTGMVIDSFGRKLTTASDGQRVSYVRPTCNPQKVKILTGGRRSF
jgi:hypothetical protein